MKVSYLDRYEFSNPQFSTLSVAHNIQAMTRTFGGLLSPVGAMESELCPFSVLPVAVRDSILTQAFQQLDQRRLLTITPFVCHLWHQLSLSTCTSLEMKLTTLEAAQQFAAWVLKHGPRLQNLEVDFVQLHPPHALYVHMGPVVQAISAASNLCLLHLSCNCDVDFDVDFGLHESSDGRWDLPVSLSSLSSLSSLTISHGLHTSSMLPVIASLSQLRSLSLTYLMGRGGENGFLFLPTIASSLVQLTNLEVSGSRFLYGDGNVLSVLRSLTGLQQLRLDAANISSKQLSALDGLPVTAIEINMGLNRLSTISSWLQPRLLDKLECVQLLEDQYVRMASGGAALVELSSVLLSAGPQFCKLHLDVVNPCPLVSHLSGLTQLTELALFAAHVDEASLRSLAALVGLRCLMLPAITVQREWAEGAVLEVAGALHELTELHLWGLGDDDDSAVTPTILEGLGSRVVRQDGNILFLLEVE